MNTPTLFHFFFSSFCFVIYALWAMREESCFCKQPAYASGVLAGGQAYSPVAVRVFDLRTLNSERSLYVPSKKCHGDI